MEEIKIMSDTLYYIGKIKRNAYPSELYEKINMRYIVKILMNIWRKTGQKNFFRSI